METKYTNVVLVNKNQYLSKNERAEILHYANTFIWGTTVEDSERTYMMQIRHIESNVFESTKARWQNFPLSNNLRYLEKAHTVLIKLK